MVTISELEKHWAEGGVVDRFASNFLSLRGADLYGAYLYGAYLYGADLEGANLRGANLRGADLSHANLRHANLRHANLRGADLEGANLRGADLRGAALRSAYVQGANLRGADLSNCVMNWLSHVLVAERLRQAAGDDFVLRLAAGFILVSLDLCHADLLGLAPDIPHEEHGTVKKWTLAQLKLWKTEGDKIAFVLGGENDTDD